MSKHTQGPWIISESPVSPEILEITSKRLVSSERSDDLIANVSGSWVGPVEALANAKLIAAAPDLLEALQNFRSMWAAIGHIEVDTKLAKTIKKVGAQASAAITKATATPTTE